MQTQNTPHLNEERLKELLKRLYYISRALYKHANPESPAAKALDEFAAEYPEIEE